MKKLMLTMAMMAALKVCATMVNAGTNNLPANYKAAALVAVKHRLKDPDSVRTLRLSPVCPFDLPNGTTSVIVEVNAKNSFGGYTGLEAMSVYFKDGKIVDTSSR
jgi:hypothetical protein